MPKRGENVRKRKDGRWEGRIICGYKPDGKAKYKSVYGASYSEVKKKLIQTNECLQKGKYAEPYTNMSFREVLFLWLGNRKTKLRPQTYAKYSKLIENHLEKSIGTYKLKQIDSTMLNRFIDEKLCNGRLDGKGGLSAGYIKTLVFIIRSTLSFAAQQGFCALLNGEIGVPPKEKRRISVFTVYEQEKLEKYIQADMDGTKLGVFICLNTGLRLGEICGLKWSDIDFKQRTISVCRTVQRRSNQDSPNCERKTELTVGAPKTPTSFRLIPIPSFLFPLLLEQSKSAQSEWVTATNGYGIPDPRLCQYRFKKYLKDCSLPYRNFHSLRHSFATRCIEAGIDVKSLSEILGHSSVNITLNTYVHSSLEQKREQIELLEAIKGQKKGHRNK